MIYTVTLNPARDRSVVIPDFAAGKVNRVVELRDDPGGKGINVSKIIKVLGGESVAMGILGGSTGNYIQTAVDALGIRTDFVFTEKETRTNIKISDPVRHETTDINEKGEIRREDAENVLNKLLTVLKKDDIVVIAGKLDVKTVDIPLWIESISEKGAQVYLDTEGEALRVGVQSAPYLIKPNDAELAQLLGHEISGIQEIIAAAREMIRVYAVHTVVVSLGGDGAVFVTEDRVCRCEGLHVECVSTVGAGDTMMAALAYAFSSGKEFVSGCVLSVAASAAAVTCPGTSSPTLETIQQLLPQVKPILL